MSETKQLQLHFWKAFNEYAFMQEDFRRLFSPHKALPMQCYDLRVGKSHSFIRLSINTQKKQITTSIYISNNKELYDIYLSKKTIY